MEYTEKLSVNKSSSRRINENNLKKNWFERLSRTGRRRRRRWIIPLENLAIPREKFICSILRPRSRNSPTRKGNDDRSTLSRRAYLLSPLLNLISRRGRSLVNHSVFRDSSSFHSTDTNSAGAHVAPFSNEAEKPFQFSRLVVSQMVGPWKDSSGRLRNAYTVQIIQRLSFDCSWREGRGESGGESLR